MHYNPKNIKLHLFLLLYSSLRLELFCPLILLQRQKHQKIVLNKANNLSHKVSNKIIPNIFPMKKTVNSSVSEIILCFPEMFHKGIFNLRKKTTKKKQPMTKTIAVDIIFSVLDRKRCFGRNITASF